MAGTRFYRPRGRFFSDQDEVSQINRAMDGYQDAWGTHVDWWFFIPVGGQPGDTEDAGSVFDNLYDEGDILNASGTGGKKYRPLFNVPVLSSSVVQGDEQSTYGGMASYDVATLRMSYEQARKVGISSDLIATRDRDLFDRFVYRNKVYDVRSIRTAGHVSDLGDLVVLVRGNEIRADELSDSSQFGRYAQQN